MFSGSNLSTLRVKLLKMIDNYNSNDLTGVNSSGEIADICLNLGLQTIYSMLKSSLFLEANGSLNLSTVANQAFVELSDIPDHDIIVGVRDFTNNLTLQEITKERYLREVPTPSKSTGTPYRYCRIADRLFFDPQPTSVITYWVDYIRSYPNLVNDADVALLPPHFDAWILKEAKVEWYQMEDKDGVPAMAISERNDAREIFMADALSNKNNILQGGSYFKNNWRPRVDPYNHVG